MARTSKFTARDRLDFAAFKAQGLSDKAIGAKYGVSHTTVNNQLSDLQLEVAKEIPEMQQYMKNLEFILGEKIAMVLDQITPEKAAEANIAQLATALTMLNNMRRLEGNPATTSTEVKYSRVNLDEYRSPVSALPAQVAKVAGGFSITTREGNKGVI